MLYYVLAACLVYVLTLVYFFIPSPYVEGSKFAKKNQTVVVLVLGDIGRSPRMQYHASSLSRAGFKVQLVGYKGSTPHKSLMEDPNVHYQFIAEVPETFLSAPPWLFPIIGPLKVLHQLFFLLIILGYAIDPPAYILVQNPPSIPTLFLGRCISLVRKSRLVIDWHNLGYSILGLKLGASHPMVTISKIYERFAGGSAYAHLTVTDSMKSFIQKEFRVKGRIESLHDRPPAHFTPLTLQEKEAFLTSCSHTADFRSEKDKLIISSTSWTPDEDFGILLDALVAYDSRTTPKPSLLVIITGKGPMKSHFEKLISRLSLSSVTIKCIWLSADDYPRLLACADLGISLHTSSSGLDLPMKIVDMFGCGLPVLAMRFACIQELVVEGLNGRTFADAEDLEQCLSGLFIDMAGKAHLESMKKGAIDEGTKRWSEEWTRVAGQIFTKRT